MRHHNIIQTAPDGERDRLWPAVMAMDEVAEIMGISRQRVQQLEHKALRKLRLALIRFLPPGR